MKIEFSFSTYSDVNNMNKRGNRYLTTMSNYVSVLKLVGLINVKQDLLPISDLFLTIDFPDSLHRQYRTISQIMPYKR